MVAGARCEVQKRNRTREPEVVSLAFRTRGTALVPVGAVPVEDGAPTSARVAVGRAPLGQDQ